MNNQDIEMLVVLGEEMNLTTAAQRLYISQPALTYRLRSIEKELGAALFIRKTKGLELTAAGKVALAYAESIRQEYAGLKERIASVTGNQHFALRIAVSPAYTKYKLPAFLARFAKSNPEIEIFVESHNSTSCLDLLREKKVHIAIIRGDHKWTGGSIYLGSDAICLVTDRKVEISDLPSMPFISYLTDPILSKTISDWWIEYFKTPPHTIMHINDSDACRQFVAEGLGYSILPSNYRADKRIKNLVVTPLYHVDGKPLVRTSWVNYYKSGMHNPAIHQFVEELLDFTKWQNDL